ncbi:MAG: hypothetical protein HC905_18855 [Bacteroidales bacterium]|nr:hypothetical protein [Bacteroidales bacterium]
MEKNGQSTGVLINGAGPSGLMLACQLAIHNIPFRIIDKKLALSKFSGAMIIHARTLEIFYQMGISVKVLKEGLIAQKLSLKFNRKTTISLHVSNMGGNLTLFPYMLLLEQWKLEMLLAGFIQSHGYEIERGTTLLSFSQKDGQVTSVLKKPDGMGEIVHSRFLIGAGGSTSLVRRQLRIPFWVKRILSFCLLPTAMPMLMLRMPK